METMVKAMTEQMKDGQAAGFQEAMKNKGVKLSDEDMKRARVHLDAMIDDVFTDFPYDEMITKTVEIYQKHFTSGDISALVAFYNSPAGKKFLAELPSLTQESMRAGAAVMQVRIPEITKHIEERTEQLIKEFSQTPAAKQ